MGVRGVKKVTGCSNGVQWGDKSPGVTQWGSGEVKKVPGGHNGGQEGGKSPRGQQWSSMG